MTAFGKFCPKKYLIQISILGTNEKQARKGFRPLAKCDVGNWKIHMCDTFKILEIFSELFRTFWDSFVILQDFFCNSSGILSRI